MNIEPSNPKDMIYPTTSMVIPVKVGLRIVYWRGDRLVDTTLIRWN